MKKRILSFEQDGKTVLGFDTGLNAQAFAQAKIPQFITRPGHIVYPDGRLEAWQPGGVIELDSMVIWGPLFPGERLDEIIAEAARQDEALNLLWYWLRARQTIEENFSGEDLPFPGPAGVLIATGKQGSYAEENQASLALNSGEPRQQVPVGTVFFPPARLIKRSLEAGGSSMVIEASRWVHPDLTGPAAISFCAGAMLYRIFCGLPPFSGENPDELPEDIREGVYIPPNLASPGLAPEMSEIIIRALSTIPPGRDPKNRGLTTAPAPSGGGNRPSPNAIYDLLTPSTARSVSSWLKPLKEEELVRIQEEREQFSKKKALAVKTRRFVIRNTTILAMCLIAAIAVAFSVRGFIRHRAELPTTKGMTPVEVAEAYYGSFADLNHTLMEACVTGKAGKGDIEMVINFFVISRTRQAYEMNQGIYIPAQEWVNAGRPFTDRTVFGITDLRIGNYSTNDETGAVNFEAEYVLWIPGSALDSINDNPADSHPTDYNPANENLTGESSGAEDYIPQPAGFTTRDRLSLVLRKDAWRIAEIDRISQPFNR